MKQEVIINKNKISKVERFRQFRKQIRGSKRYLIAGIDVAKQRGHVFILHFCQELRRDPSGL